MTDADGKEYERAGTPEHEGDEARRRTKPAPWPRRFGQNVSAVVKG
jgi:hypothetical protein